jgi:hypothetical protein
MVPEIKSYALTDGKALEAYRPEDPEDFNVTLRLIIGPRGHAGAESFDITICTPKSLAEGCAATGFVLGRHRLVVSAYNPLLIMSALRKLVARCNGLSWPEVGSKIARIALWEFEDYEDA